MTYFLFMFCIGLFGVCIGIVIGSLMADNGIYNNKNLPNGYQPKGENCPKTPPTNPPNMKSSVKKK